MVPCLLWGALCDTMVQMILLLKGYKVLRQEINLLNYTENNPQVHKGKKT